tara:strand:- start:2897 stop:3274 length:378 start_codon:yes stop_codon:yes gene_type:complete
MREKSRLMIRQLASFAAAYEAQYGMPPSTREMRDALGLKSDSGIRSYIKQAIDQGLMFRRVSARGGTRKSGRSVAAVLHPVHKAERADMRMGALERKLHEAAEVAVEASEALKSLCHDLRKGQAS